MNVEVKNSIATITMSVDELGMLRYALAQGVQEMRSWAIYNKSMKNEYEKSSTESVNKAQKVSDDLESAVRYWIDGGSEVV